MTHAAENISFSPWILLAPFSIALLQQLTCRMSSSCRNCSLISATSLPQPRSKPSSYIRPDTSSHVACKQWQYSCVSRAHPSTSPCTTVAMQLCGGTHPPRRPARQLQCSCVSGTTTTVWLGANDRLAWACLVIHSATALCVYCCGSSCYCLLRWHLIRVPCLVAAATSQPKLSTVTQLLPCNLGGEPALAAAATAIAASVGGAMPTSCVLATSEIC